MSSLKLPLYVVISGNSGAGKSTFLRLLGETLQAKGRQIDLIDEGELHHGFLQRMFDDPAKWALPVQINFAIQRAMRLLAAVEQGCGLIIAMERCLLEDQLFVDYYTERGSIDHSGRAFYDQMSRYFLACTPTPNLIIHLRGDADVLVERLEAAHRSRSRPVQLSGERLRDYIGRMNQMYSSWAAAAPHLCGSYTEYPITHPRDQIVRDVIAFLDSAPS